MDGSGAVAVSRGPLAAFDVIAGRRSPASDLTPYTAVVVRVENTGDSIGAYVARLGEDTRYPTGPCWGPHVVETIGAGDVVLVVPTDDGLWVAAVHQPPQPPPP